MLIYIHIPYCDSKCYYCSFNSYVDKFDTKKSYSKALLRQFEKEIKRFSLEPNSLETLFIGGGTPSTMPPALYRDIFAELKPFLREDAEITTEANPNSATTKWLEGVKELGVNRISFGVQSFNDDKLKSLGRAHNSQMAKDAIKRARGVGFENISLDLIYNYKSDTKELLKKDIDLALELEVEHLSAYELTIEPNTLFESTPKEAKDDENLARFVSYYINKQGLAQYEVSNYGKVSKHNFGYWKLKNYIGLGAGAVGFLDDIRIYPTKSIDSYIQNPTSTYIEKLSKESLVLEKIFLGLRSAVGVELEILSDIQRVELLKKERKIYQKGDRIYSYDYFLADEIALFLVD
jgi:oxygen-independent coproporphyrinogen-3 oxidase